MRVRVRVYAWTCVCACVFGTAAGMEENVNRGPEERKKRKKDTTSRTSTIVLLLVRDGDGEKRDGLPDHHYETTTRPPLLDG